MLARVMLLTMALRSTQAAACSNATFTYDLSKLQLVGTKFPAATSAAGCVAACCAHTAAGANCSAWQWHVSSTNPSHHPKECWLFLAPGAPRVLGPTDKTDKWVGGATSKPSAAPAPSATGGGAVIQPLSSWAYYGADGNLHNTLNTELTEQSIRKVIIVVLLLVLLALLLQRLLLVLLQRSCCCCCCRCG